MAQILECDKCKVNSNTHDIFRLDIISNKSTGVDEEIRLTFDFCSVCMRKVMETVGALNYWQKFPDRKQEETK